MVKSGSDSDSDGKRDTVPKLKTVKKATCSITEATCSLSLHQTLTFTKGKKPIEDILGELSLRQSRVAELITRLVQDILIEDAKHPTRMRTSLNKLMAEVESIVREAGLEIDMNVVTSSYSLRSGSKVLDVDLGNRKRKGKEKKTDETAFEKVRKSFKRETLNAVRKRKGKEETEARDDSGLEADPEEGCKILKKGRNNDEDDADKDGTSGSSGAYATRSSTRNMMIKSN